MATEQLKPGIYKIAGQHVFAGALLDQYEIIDSKPGFAEDGETKHAASGQFNADLVYSRRETLSLTIQSLHGSDPEADFCDGGQLVSGILPKADGTTVTAWNIQSAQATLTRGVKGATVELIEQGDSL